MINEKNLNKMCDVIIDKDNNNKELTTKELNNCGFTSKDISKLIDENKLERVKRGHYLLKNIDDLIFYGKKLIGQEEYEKATACFWKCYELQPDNQSVCFQLFLRAIQKDNYEEAFKFFNNFYNEDNKFYQKDNHLYLFLLNYITNIPDKYKEVVKNINFKGVEIDLDDKRYDKKDIQNKMRKSLLNYNFTYALKLINEERSKNGKLILQNIVVKTLLYQAIKKDKKIKKDISLFIKNKDYMGLKEYLEELGKTIKFNKYYKYLLQITNDLCNLDTNLKLPQIFIESTSNVFRAIEGNNYSLALSLYKRNVKSNNLIYLLLLEFDNVKKEKNIENKNFIKIFDYLSKNDIEKTIKTLRVYLKEINRIEYEFLIINLIKISVYENDLTYIKPRLELSNMTNQNYEFNISKYIENFRDALSQNKIKEARIYLTIIKKLNTLNKANISIAELEKEINEKDKEEVNIEEFIKKNREKLTKDGIIILEPMNNEERSNIHKYILLNTPEIAAFTIGEDNKKRIVLREREEKYIDIPSTFKKGIDAYNNNKNDLTIKYFRQLLKAGNPNYLIFLKLGLSYLKIQKKNKKLALSYLIVANELARKNNINNNLSYLIGCLKGEYNWNYSKPERKPYVNVKKEEFNELLSENYGIENIDEIANLMQEGVNFKDIINKFELNNDQMCLVALIFAKNFYANKNFTLGDYYLKLVERTKNKSKFVNKLFTDVRNSKRFYQYRVSETNKPLVLLPQTKY